MAVNNEAVAYEPRAQFLPFHLRQQRWSCLVCHRRAGKTYAAIGELITRALATRKQDARYAYVAPFYRQAKDVSWSYLKKLTQQVSVKVSESELTVDLVNGSRIRLYGADSADSLRGIYLDGVVLDEAADMRRSVWPEVIRPMLADRKGWATWIGTPRGHDHFYQIHQEALASPDWFSMTLKASETGLIPQAELDDARRGMTDDLFKQEFEVSFESAIAGAIYAKELQAARDTGRIGRVPWDPALPVHTIWDLAGGHSKTADSTAIWFAQTLGLEARLIDYYEASGEGLPYYAKILQDRGYVYGRHIAPHDIRVGEMGTGRTRIEVAKNLGIKFEIAPEVSLEDGIHAGRMWMARCWFDETKCKAGLEALQHYQWTRNERLDEFKSTPVHNWATHGSDAFRYAALALKDKPQVKPARPQREHFHGGEGWMR